MLTTEQQLIADVIGYTPLTQEEGQESLDLEVNFVNDGKSVPFNGAIAVVDGVKKVYWMPQSRMYREEFDDLVDWYEIPSMEEIEAWTFDSVCPTPIEDDVEPDHPDSWLRLLGMI